MNVGANIRRIRRALDITQRELADKVEVDQSMICQIERGTRVPSLPLSMQIADALGCDIKELTV